jgi:hypothetical protein
VRCYYEYITDTPLNLNTAADHAAFALCHYVSFTFAVDPSRQHVARLLAAHRTDGLVTLETAIDSLEARTPFISALFS